MSEATSDFIRGPTYVNATVRLAATTLVDASSPSSRRRRNTQQEIRHPRWDVLTDERHAHPSEIAEGVHMFQNAVTGSGQIQFEYTGRWIHANGTTASDATDTYSISAGARVQMRFAALLHPLLRRPRYAQRPDLALRRGQQPVERFATLWRNRP